jgi:hypothetical protein
MTSAGYEREPDRDEWQGMTKDWGKVREFARKMYEALNDDAWGAIEPELFDEIAAVDKNDLSDDARSLANAIEQAL